MNILQDIGEAVRQVADAVGPAVVTVGPGTGIVVADGQVATNAHNLRNEHPTIHFGDGHSETGTILAADLEGDLALIAVGTEGIVPVAVTEDAVAHGQAVVSLARPRRRGLAVAQGSVAIIDARFRGPHGNIVSGAFEHTTRLPRGSSGGPVVDHAGRLVGINTHRRRDGYYAAIAASDELRTRLDELASGTVPVRPRLGITIAPPQVAAKLRASVGLEPRAGLLIREVEPDGPAANAGLDAGDLIVDADGTALEGPDDLHALLLAGVEQLVLLVIRGEEERQVTVTFGDAN